MEKEGLIKLSSSGEVQVVLSEEFNLYNLINVPNKMTNSEVLNLLALQESEVRRIYKQSLYWYIVIDDNSVNAKLRQLLESRTVKVNDLDLKYDLTPARSLRKTIMKKTQHLNYIKETDDLKASSPQSNRKDSEVKNYNSNLSNTSEHFSWRKKSDVSNNSNDNNLSNGKKDKPVSAFSQSSNANGFPRRERFNSDPNEKYTPKYTRVEEVVIDPKLVNYTLKISNKYSTREMFDFYSNMKDKLSKTSPTFNLLVEEVCNDKAKDCTTFLLTSKDRSKTFCGNFDFKSSINERLPLPRNNPLHDMKELKRNLNASAMTVEAKDK